MSGIVRDVGRSPRHAASIVALILVVGGGIATLLFVWHTILEPDDLGLASLPVVAFVAAVASAFSPCGLPALPAFLTFSGAGANVSLRRRSGLALSVSGGAVAVVLVFGVVVAAAGAGTDGLVSPHLRWVQLALGVGLIGLAVLHFAGRSERLPLIGRVIALGGRAWDASMERPTPRGGFLFGAGYVAVGAG